MFEEISGFLLVYEKYGSHFQERAGSEGEIPARLRQTLADVYVDIISFCHRVLRLFSSNSRGRFGPSKSQIAAITLFSY